MTNLSNCKDCRARVSVNAVFCPSCNAHDPVNRGSRVLKGLFIGLGVVILALALFVYCLGI